MPLKLKLKTKEEASIMQKTFYDFSSAFETLKDKKPLLVCDDAFDFLNIKIPGSYYRRREAFA